MLPLYYKQIIAQIDNLLTATGTGTISYNTSEAPSASATLTVTVNDSGNTGADPGTSGGPADEEGTNNVTINLSAINDAPVVGAPGAPLAARVRHSVATPLNLFAFGRPPQALCRRCRKHRQNNGRSKNETF